MPLAQVLADFSASLTQCDHLIATAHTTDASGFFIFSPLDREQITVGAFLNAFIAWETFLESSLVALMIGEPTLSGQVPVKYVAPLTGASAKTLMIGTQRYFDFGNHDNVRRIVAQYFELGYPFEPHLSGVFSDLADLRTMRNASAHITSTTQTALESLALRVLQKPQPGIKLYSFLTVADPRSTSGETVFASLKARLLVVAELIVKG